MPEKQPLSTLDTYQNYFNQICASLEPPTLDLFQQCLTAKTQEIELLKQQSDWQMHEKYINFWEQVIEQPVEQIAWVNRLKEHYLAKYRLSSEELDQRAADNWSTIVALLDQSLARP